MDLPEIIFCMLWIDTGVLHHERTYVDINEAGWELRTIDQQIEELLHSDISCSIALPRLPKRVALEDSKLLKGARVSVLDEDWDVSTYIVPR